MQKTLQYTISSFKENEIISISAIRNVMDTTKSTWKTKSSHAVLEINFEAVRAFEINICNVYLGLLTPLILKISTEYGDAYEKQLYFKKIKKKFIFPAKKLKLPCPDIDEIAYLKFEFTKINEFIEVEFIILQTPKNLVKKSENSSKSKSYKQKMLEKIESEAGKKVADQKKIFESPLVVLPPIVEETMIKQQERLKSYLPEETRFKEEKYITRSSIQELKLSQSYSGLLNNKVTFVNIEQIDLKKVVLELLDVMGSVYIDSFSDACNLVISEDVSGIWEIEEVSYKWLFECVKQRKLCSFDLLK